MKKVILSGILLLATFSIKAQNCHYDSNDTDPITGKTVKQIDCKLAKSWRIVFSKQDDVMYVSVFMVLPGDQRAIMSKGDSAIVRLGNNQVITLYAANDVVPTAFVGGHGVGAQVYSSYSPVYPCDADKMKQLSTSPITAMRFYAGSDFVTLPEVKGKSAEKIQNAAACIQQ